MIITNKHHYPQAVVDACRLDDYDRGKSDITVTELIGPPQIRKLRAQHEGEIEVDVSQMMWALRGKAKHYILEKAGEADPNAWAERRMYADFPLDDGRMVTLGGQLDLYYPGTGELWDYKETSVWTYIYRDRDDDSTFKKWIEQLNVLAYILVSNGENVRSLKIFAMWREWSERNAKWNADFPDLPEQPLDIEMWDRTTTRDFIDHRLRMHYDMDPPPLCTDGERWFSDQKYAVMAPGRKNAIKLFDKKDKAEKFMKKDSRRGLYIEGRGEPYLYRRCLKYCEVASFCSQWQEDKRERESLLQAVK